MRTFFVVPLLVLLAACGAQEPLRPGADKPQTVTSSINLSGFPPDFRRGFSAGCDAARANDPSRRPKGDGPYAVGWNDGFDYCRPKK
jgi:predicted small lipoprotein YifL